MCSNAAAQRPSHRRHAAIHEQQRAGDVGRIVGGQEQDRGGDRFSARPRALEPCRAGSGGEQSECDRLGDASPDLTAIRDVTARRSELRRDCAGAFRLVTIGSAYASRLDLARR